MTRFLVSFTISDTKTDHYIKPSMNKEWIKESLKNVGFINMLGGADDIIIYKVNED